MKITKISIIIIALILILPNVISGLSVNEQKVSYSGVDKNPLIDITRAFKIDFNPPDIISECGSLFFLNVSVEKARFENLPRIFSLSVFLKTEDNLGGNKITKIGSVPIIHIPYYQQQKYISIPCVTSNKLLDYIYCLRTGEKSGIKLEKGYIGVRLERTPRWFFDGIFSRAVNWFLNLKIQIPWSIIVGWLSGYLFPRNTQQFGETIKKMVESDNIPTTNKIRLFSFLQIFNSWLIDLNPFIVWKDVKLTPPFLCSTDVNIKDVTMDNRTDSNGKFNVTVEIANNLDIDIAVCVNVDIADEPLFVNFIPTSQKSYNVGYFKENISRKSDIRKTILCSFPEKGMKNRNYSVTLECGSYIPIDDTNQFGLLFYDLRWIVGVNPTYEVNGTVKNAIKKLWYNVPIFYGGSKSASVFPVYHGLTYYKGNESLDELEKILNPLSEEIKNWIYLYLLCSLLIIGAACLCYCGLKIYSNKKGRRGEL